MSGSLIETWNVHALPPSIPYLGIEGKELITQMSTFTVLMVTTKVTTSWGPWGREGFLWGKQFCWAVTQWHKSVVTAMEKVHYTLFWQSRRLLKCIIIWHLHKIIFVESERKEKSLKRWMFYSSQNVNSYYFSVLKSQVIFLNFFFSISLWCLYLYVLC